MPKEKSLFFIGIWIIILSNFIGLSTEIKNYIFIATGVLITVLSYTIGNSNKENFFQNKKIKVEEKISEFKKEIKLKPIIRKERISIKKSPVFITKKEIREVEEEIIPEISKSIDTTKNPFSDYDNLENSYEPPIKVRRARIKPKRTAKFIEEKPLENITEVGFEDDDVIVISSDGDVSRE